MPVALTDGFVNAFWAGAAIAFVGVLVSIFLVRGRDLRAAETVVRSRCSKRRPSRLESPVTSTSSPATLRGRGTPLDENGEHHSWLPAGFSLVVGAGFLAIAADLHHAPAAALVS